MNLLAYNDFPFQSYDKLRYGDTDRQGHVNNAVFSTFLETGRVEFLYKAGAGLMAEDVSFVIAGLQLNFIREVKWPGTVEIGTGITKIGNSSIKIYQQLFQNEICVASAETVIVQVDNKMGKSVPLSDEVKESLSQWLLEQNI